MAEHLLHRAQVCATFEQVCGERVPQEVGMHAFRLEACLPGQASEDEERAGAREAASLGVEEQLRPVLGVQIRAST
jgi:hypothetical protein